MEHRWNDTDQEIIAVFGKKNLFQCQFVHHKPQLNYVVWSPDRTVAERRCLEK